MSARRAIVLGAGRSGNAARAVLARDGYDVTVLDGDAAFPEDVGPDTVCVTSPGIALDHPWQRAARAAGLRVMSELELGARHFAGRMLAVTGSKGKSSVVKLLAEGLTRAGARAVPCGNYGTPLCAVALEEPAPAWAVVEVSSFQMETTEAFHPEAAVILNLQDDHLDRHGSREVYHALKNKLLTLAKAAPRADAADAPLLAGSYFDNPVLRANGLHACALFRAAGLDDAAIRAAFAAFAPLPHRMQTVCVRGGVTCIDDSKATSLAALAAGVEMAAARPGCAGVRLIAGGLAKGDDPISVIPPLRTHTQKVYLIGRCAERFSDAWRTAVPCEICGTLDRAVGAALRDACAGEVLLLSPGTASFDQFNSYGERGDAFAALVKRKTENEC